MKKFLAIVAVLLLLLLVLVGSAPTLVNLGLGRGALTNAIGGSIDGTVTIDVVSLGWFSKQSLRGVRVDDRQGERVADLDVTVDAGLAALLLGRVDTIDVHLAGALNGSLEEDGSTSFAGVVASGEPDPNASSGASGPPSVGGLPAARLSIDAIKLTLALPGAPAGQSLVLEKLTGQATYTPGGTCELALASPTVSGPLRGSIDLRGTARGLFDETGTLTPRGAAVEVTLAARGLPVPFDERVDEIRTLDIALKTADLAERLDLKGQVDTVAGGATSVLRAELSALAPVRDDGTLAVGLDTLGGEINGKRVPTALFQPALAGTPLRLTRDLGSTVDVIARLAPEPDGGKRIDVELTAARASLVVDASMATDGAIDGRRLVAETQLQPELVAGLRTDGSGPALETPVAVKIEATSFRIPARRDDGTISLAEIGFDGRLTVPGAARVAVAPDAFVTAGQVAIDVKSDSLREGVRLVGSAGVNGGVLEIDEHVTELFDDEGGLAPERARPVGTLVLRGVDSGPLARVVTADMDAGPTRALIEGLMTGPLTASMTTSDREGDLRAAIDVGTGAMQASTEVIRRGDGLSVISAEATATVTPALGLALQEGEADPVLLAAPTSLAFTIGAIELPGAFRGELDLSGTRLEGTLKVAEADVSHVSLHEPVGIIDLTAELGRSAGPEAVLTLRGDARIDRAISTQPIGHLKYDLAVRQAGEATRAEGTIQLEELAIAALEAVLGETPDALVGWLGATGRLGIELADAGGASQVTLHAEMPNLRGTLIASAEDDVLVARAETLALTLRAAKLAELFGVEPTAERTPPPPVRVDADLPMTLAVESLRLPSALLRGEAFDPALVIAKATVAGGPLRLVATDGTVTIVDRFDARVGAEDLANGVTFTMKGATSTSTAEQAGTVDVSGTVRRLVTTESKLDVAGAEIDLDARAEHVPTIVADSLLGLQDLLVAAVGAEMNCTFTARGFSREAGQLDVVVDTSNGHLAGRVLGSEGLLLTTSDEPVQGHLQITPALGARLLRKIHPVLADIETTEKPMRFALTEPARIPTDGDVSKLNADLEIDIGAVQFSAGSATLRILNLFAEDPNATIPGSIEPIVAKIRDGVVTYDRFAMHIDKFTLAYTGKVDLPNRTLDLRTEIPLAALGGTFRELEGRVDDLVIPFVTRGSIDAPKTEMDPSFDLGSAVVQSGIGGLIDDAIKDEKIPKEVGDIIGNIFGGKKKKDDGK